MIRKFLLVLGLLFPAALAQAQSTPVAKILVVDFDRVSRESLVGKDISAQFESNRLSLEQQAREVQQALSQEQSDLEQQRSIISQDAFQERVRAFQQKAQQKQNQLKQLTNQARQSMQQANLEVQRVLRPIVKNLMEEKGANFVLDKALVAQHAGGLDITTEVIERLDQAMPTYKVNLPDPNSLQAGN
ncbi:MAG: OmpH family outer membrane protein [Rhodothalassiaceae bacterium]